MAKAATKTTTSKAPARNAAAKTISKTSAKATKAPVRTAAAKAAAKAASKAAGAKTAKASAPVGATASPILTLRHLAERLSETHEVPKRQTIEMLTQVVEMITRSLKKGEKIRLTGLGILQVRKRAARTGRNPQTGEPIKIKASRKIAFRPAKELKEAI